MRNRMAGVPLLLSSILFGATFTVPPSLTESGPSLSVNFTVSAPTDVEVAILDKNGRVVRHLAAGVIGGEAASPEPLDSGLVQTISWDGLGDDGELLFSSPYRVRVRLGVFPEFSHRISTKVYPNLGVARFWLDTTDYYPGNLGVDSNVSTDSLIPITHPVWRVGGGSYRFPDTFAFGQFKIKFYECHPKLDMAVSDLDDRIVIQHIAPNSLGAPVALLDGISGSTLKIWTVSPRTMYGAAAMWYYGEPFFDYYGRFILRDDGSTTPGMWRLTPEGTPLPFASGTNGIIQAARPGSDLHQRGVCTDRWGNIYHGHYPPTGMAGVGPGLNCNISKFDSNGVLMTDSLVQVWGNIGQGVKVDPKGNIFIGARVTPYPDSVPREIRSRLQGTVADKYSQAYWAQEVYGSIIKFGPEGGKIVPNTTGDLLANDYWRRASGVGIKWMHFGASFQPSHSSGATCICFTPRFDVDRFGRVFFPNPFENEFKALDNNGNLMFRAHNRDFIDKVKIGLIQHVQVTDRAIYGADHFNSQIVCFKWGADAETLLAVSAAAVENAALGAAGAKLSSSPNPMNGRTILRYRLDDRTGAGFMIYDAAGRMVRDLTGSLLSERAGSLSWDGRNGAGMSVGAGVYFAVLRDGKNLTRLPITVLR